jgi:hypothetical protein
MKPNKYDQPTNNHQLDKEITKLTKEWYYLIGPEHHKDRDCHWFIHTNWSYGEKPTFTIRHNGYILDEIVIPCESYQEALERLQKLLVASIEKEKESHYLEMVIDEK